jgi:uncharacterized integral membrane protein
MTNGSGPRPSEVPSSDVSPVDPLSRRARRWRHRWTVRLVIAAVATAAVTFVAAANYVHVEVRLIGWQGEVRLSWALLGAVAFGGVLGLLAARPWR